VFRVVLQRNCREAEIDQRILDFVEYGFVVVRFE
jgi:hypothetical protein